MEVSSVKTPVLKPYEAGSPAANKPPAKPEPTQQADLRQEASMERDQHIKAQKTPDISMLEIARQVSETLKRAGIKIEFDVNQDENRVVIVVKDPVSGQVIRQIPPEEYSRMLSQLKKLQSDHQNQGIELDVRF